MLFELSGFKVDRGGGHNGHNGAPPCKVGLRGTFSYWIEGQFSRLWTMEDIDCQTNCHMTSNLHNFFGCQIQLLLMKKALLKFWDHICPTDLM